MIPIAPEKIRKLTLAEIASFTTNDYLLSEMLVYAACGRCKTPPSGVVISEYPGVIYMRIEDGPIYQALQQNEPAIYEKYTRSGRTWIELLDMVKTFANQGYDHNRLMYINKTIQDKYGWNVINDGHHRASIFLWLYGDNLYKFGEIRKGA